MSKKVENVSNHIFNFVLGFSLIVTVYMYSHMLKYEKKKLPRKKSHTLTSHSNKANLEKQFNPVPI